MQDGWGRRVNVVNETGTEKHGNYRKQYENIIINNTTEMQFIITLYMPAEPKFSSTL